MRKIHDIIADPQTGYILNSRGFFSVIVPEETVNLIADPHSVIDTAYFGPHISRDETITRRGIYSHKVIAANAFSGIGYLLPAALDRDQPYTFSCDLRGIGQFEMYFCADFCATTVGPELVQGTGLWTRVSITRYIRLPNINYVIIMAAKPTLFYVDGFQVENKDHPTTFASGALATSRRNAYSDYAWLGAPNRSMSLRTRNTLDGGRVVPLSDLGFDVTGFSQMGFSEQTNQFEDYALLPGSFYLGSRSGRRTFTLTGNIGADGLQPFLKKRFHLGQGLTGGDETSLPVTLVCQLFDEEMPISEEITLTAVYKSGLDGNIDNLYQEKAAIVMEAGTSLFEQTGVSATIAQIQRFTPSMVGIIGYNDDGIVKSIGASCSLSSRGMVVGPDNNLYAACGINIVQFNGFDDTVVYSGTDQITALAAGPDGLLYFATVDSLFRCHLRTLDLTSGAQGDLFNASTSTLSAIYTICTGKNGLIYFGGFFSSITNTLSGTITCRNIVRYNIRTGIFSAMSTGLGTDLTYRSTNGNAAVYAIIVDNQGLVWAGGCFSNGSDIQNNIHNLAIWDGVQWRKAGNFSLGYPVSNDTLGAGLIRVMVYDKKRDIIYLAGGFDTFQTQRSTITYYYPKNIAAITADQTGWIVVGGTTIDLGVYAVTPLGGGIGYFGTNPSPGYEGEVFALALACDGRLAVSGSFAYALTQDAGDASEGSTPLNERVPAPGVALWSPDARRYLPLPFAQPSGSFPPYHSYFVPSVVYGGICDKGVTGGGDYTLGVNVFDPVAPTTFVQPGRSDSFFFNIGSANDIMSTAVNIIDNRTAVSTRPVFEVSGPGTLEYIKNLTTGKTIVVNHKILFAGETLTIDCNIESAGLFSNISGDQTNLIDPTCSFPDFSLRPGVNRLIFKIADVTDATRVIVRFKKRYASLDAIAEGHLLPLEDEPIVILH